MFQSFSMIPLILATIFQTVLGMFWFGKLFGTQWMKYMEFDKKSDAEKKEMEKHMPKLYTGQLIATIISNIVLQIAIHTLASVSPYVITGMLWLGFVLPSFATATIWSQTKWFHVPPQIVIATLYQLISMFVSTALIVTLH
jgi:hypothetical protein